MVGIRDVAKTSGAAVATVSRYLNGQISLRPETKKRIDDAIAELGYRPNAMARRLASGSSETIGLMTTDIEYPFFAAIASAAEAEASASGYQLVVFNSRNSAQKELDILRSVETRQIDGLIVLTNHTTTRDLAKQITKSGKVVLIDEDVLGAEAPRIFADNQQGGVLAADCLFKHGHTEIAFVSGPRGMISVDERLAGFRQRLAERGVQLPMNSIKCGEYSEEYGVSALKELASSSPRPTAIFAGADNIAIGILKGARECGIRIPDDLSLIGFDDVSYGELLDPPLTTIRQDAHIFGREGVRALLHLLNGEVVSEIERVKVDLILRGSVAKI